MQLEQVRAVFILAESEIPDNLDLAPVYFLKAIERAHRKIQVGIVQHVLCLCRYKHYFL